jgi:hypothetical protein
MGIIKCIENFILSRSKPDNRGLPEMRYILIFTLGYHKVCWMKCNVKFQFSYATF